MAAYAALASLINLIEDIQNHPRLSTSFDHKQLQSLAENLDFLIDFVERYSVGKGKEVEDLECRIASEVHEAEDTIESYIVDLIHSHSRSTADEVEDMKSRLETATEALDSMKKSIVEIESERGFGDQLPEYSSTRSDGSSKTTAVGFDDESFQLMERLIQPDPNRQVIPIVGVGGLGKTTLARLVYEHSFVAHHFDNRMWASISQQPRMESIISELVYGEKNLTTQTVDKLGEELHKKLWGRRYLIVLDDMWSIKTWNEIQLFLPDNGCGARVVITTRLAQLVALSSFPFEMKLLNEEKSWRLFCTKAFGEEDCPPELEEIGKNIVRKCRGLPLSIVVIGGHLGKSPRMKLYWESVGNGMNSLLDSEHDQSLNILSLSYNHLPAHLKACFLYIGVFGEGEEIKAARLINLWVAEGFIKGNEEKSKEEIGEECLKDLVDRNLILVDRWDRIGNYYSCKIHDLLRDLSISVAKKENFLSVLDTTQTIELPFVIHKNIEPEIIFHARPLVRSLKCKQGELSSKFRLVRVAIDKVDAVLNGGLLESDIQLVNLRYLECQFVQPQNALESNLCPTLHLPPSISQIWNLQTLEIFGAYDEIVAPTEIWEMTQLRHLIISRLCLPDPPHIDDPMQNLVTLVQVENFRLCEDACKRIPNIKTLDLLYNFNKESDEASIYYPQNLGCFHSLESLSCNFLGEPSCYFSARNFTFPSSLQDLRLTNFSLHWDDLTTISSLPHLVNLELLYSVDGSEWNPVEMGFPCLRFLMIYGCRNLVSWNAKSSHFPVLEDVRLAHACKLDEIPSGFADIPTLKCIIVSNCSDSAAISVAKILMEQQELGNDGLRAEVWLNNEEKLQSFNEMLQEEGLRCNNLYVNLCFECEELSYWARQDFSNLPMADASTIPNPNQHTLKMQLLGKDNIVSFIDEAKTLISYIKEDTEELDVISIIGMPGIGKTTLAKKIFNDEKIDYEFPIRIWVYVSQDCNIKEVFLTMLKKVSPQDMSNLEDHELVSKLRNLLHKEKFLLILDDIWSGEVWDHISAALPKKNRLGKVIITSRDERVARLANPRRNPHKLNFMNQQESWELLQLKVFAETNECPEELADLGKSIANQCNGVPLAIVLIGGILLKKRTEHGNVKEEWEKVSKSVHEYLFNHDEQTRTENIIQLSYNMLPSDLRDCFLYLGIFPEDTEILTWRLIRLWMAEGFVEYKAEKSLEEVGEDNLKDLVTRNLVMVDKLSATGEIKSCRVHDVIRDFCIVQAAIARSNMFQEVKFKKGEFFPAISEISISRRLSIHSYVVEFLRSKPKGRCVQSFLCSSKQSINLPTEYASAIPEGFESLRVLDTNDIKFPIFPSKITKLINLRYIVLSGVTLPALPMAFFKLWNLQTIKIDTSPKLEIKADISKMMQLRHLKTKAAIVIKKMEGKAENLQTLSRLEADCSSFNDVINKSPNLKNLGIRGNLATIQQANCLKNLNHLKKLKLVYDVFPKVHNEMPLCRLPQPERFPPNLKILNMSSTFLEWKNMSTLGMLQNLKVLKLKENAFVGMIWKFDDAGFLSLEYLYIARTDLQFWSVSDDSFPKLKCLVLKNCEKLKEIPSVFKRSLQVLDLNRVSKSIIDLGKKIEEERKAQERGRTSGFKLIVTLGDGVK